MKNANALHYENVFIRLKNQGKSIEEIKKIFKGSVTPKNINKWNEEFETQMTDLQMGEIKPKILYKDSDNIYRYSHTFRINHKNRMLLDFRRLSEPETDNPQLHFLYQKIQNGIPYIEKYLIDYSFEREINKENIEYKIGYNAYTQDESIKKIIVETLQTYLIHFVEERIQQQKYQLKIEETQDLLFEKYPLMMPYAIKQICIENYSGIHHLHLTAIPIDTQWIFFTGENGFGKTSILQAITIALFGQKDGDTILTDEKSKIAVEITNYYQNQIQDIWQEGFKSLQVLACYGSSRLQRVGNRTENQLSEKTSTTYGIFNEDALLLNIDYELLIWYLKKDKRFGWVKKILLDLMPYLADIVIDDQSDAVFYIEKDENTQIYEKMPFKNLAAGYKSLIGMVGDIIIRFYKVYPATVEPQNFSGIVIIDEFDLHWHPKWQRELPTLLSKIFPRIQFIVSTHSVIPFLGAPTRSVFFKVTRNKEEGIKVQKLDIDIRNLSPNILLTSALFDMEKITTVNLENFKDFRTEDTYQEMQKNVSLEQRLAEKSQADVNFPDDLFD